jgi:CRP-like cAMP-binding protein
MPPERSLHSAVERELFLRSLSLGRPMKSGAKQLGRAMRERFFEAGAALYEAGTPSDDVFFIVHGQVQLKAPDEPDWEFGPNSVLGTIDADLERPHSRTARAVTDVEALVLSNEDRLEVLEDNFEQARTMILFVSERLHELALRLPDLGVEPPRAGECGPRDKLEPLPLVERVLTLREVASFSRSGIQTLISLAPYLDEVRLRAGEALFDSGEVHGVLFVVARGMVELERIEPPGLARFGPGSLVGGTAALGHIEHRYRARAVDDSVVLRLRDEDLFDVMEDHFDLARSVFADLATQRERVLNRLAQRNLPLAGSAEPSTSSRVRASA